MSQSSEEVDKKPLKAINTDGPPSESKEDKSLTLKVKDQNGVELTFRYKKTATLHKLFDYYCEQMNFSAALVRFIYDGVHILAKQTPEELNLQDGDVIEVFARQDGGGCHCY
uniref:Small ubiquitin-related modifier n=1 Tax=Plectus sambesii TaxID=2011161 RepID=A0A914WDB2_9BILA